MPDRARIFHDRSDNCFVIVNNVGLWYTVSFVFSEEPQTLQQRDRVLEKVIAPKSASCDGNGRVVAARLVPCFLWYGFVSMFSLAGTVSTPLLVVTVAVHFCQTVCARNSQKAASLSS